MDVYVQIQVTSLLEEDFRSVLVDCTCVAIGHNQTKLVFMVETAQDLGNL